MGRSLFAFLGFAFLGLGRLTSAGTVVYHTETKEVAGGAELVTVYADSLPLLTVLRDSSGVECGEARSVENHSGAGAGVIGVSTTA
jgi:hypothetical protein